jgi:hypothetical protein
MVSRNALAALVLAALAPAALPARGQTPANIGAPLTGEVVLNRDVEIRSAPAESGRILLTMPQGKALNALGTPRGTNWTQVAIGGVPVGYVPADALDPVYIPPAGPDKALPGGGTGGGGNGKPAALRAALVPEEARAAVAQSAGQGALVATRNLTATETGDGGKRRSVAVRKGQVAGLTGARGTRLELTLGDGKRVEAPADGFLGVAAVGTPAGGPFYAGRLGEFMTYDEGLKVWQAFVAGPGGAYRDRPPGVWPVVRGGKLQFMAGVGPLTAGDLDRACATLTRQGYDCRPVELKRY